VAITLGAVTFDFAHTVVRETHDEVGGRRERAIEITGLIAGESSEAAIHAALDAILDAASAIEYSAALSVRPGRRMMVRRAEFVRQVSAESHTGTFTLKLAAREPHEESVVLHSVPWLIDASGDSIALTHAGNTPAPVIIRLTALDTIIAPEFSAGSNSMHYGGTLSNGDVLEFDGIERLVRLNGADVTPYVSGQFPDISPEGITLLYTDAPASAHAASVVLEYRDRWW